MAFQNCLAVFFLSHITSVVASPVIIKSSSDSACLSVIFIVIFILCLLVACKYVYMRRRRIQPINGHAQSISPRCSFAVDSCRRTSASFTSGITAKYDKGGFLVGFFGSPAWETRIKSHIGKAVWRQSSHMHQLHTKSWHRKYSSPQRSSPHEISPVVDIELGLSSISNNSDNHVLYQPISHSMRLPTYPAKVRIDSPAGCTPRRFSLPSSGSKEVHGASQKRRHSSLKHAKSRLSDASGSSIAGHNSLRLVETVAEQDLPLPLSALQERSVVTVLRSPSLSPTGGSSPKSATASSRVHTPLAVRTSSHYFPSSPVALSTESSTLHSLTPLRISHPYALVPKARYSAKGNTPMQAVSKSLPYRSLPHETSKFTSQLPISPPLPPDAAVSPSLNFSPLVLSFPSPSFFPTLSPHPAGSSRPAKSKSKAKSPSLRVRRSPAIGPSPLRTMIVADPSDIELHSKANKENANTKEILSPVYGTYASLGLGLPASRFGVEPDMLKTNSLGHADNRTDNKRRLGVLKQRNSRDEDGGGANVLLDIMQELVEETSHWDASLFMDANFKSMIRNSGIIPSIDAEGNLVSPESAGSADVRNNTSAKPSEELHHKLLKPDISQNDGAVDNRNIARSLEGCEIDQVSLKEESAGIDGNFQQENVGLAW